MRTINYRRYKVASTWRRSSTTMGGYAVEYADLADKRTGTIYNNGAARVVNDDGETVNAKGEPSPRTVFAGETAWMSAESVMRDAAFAARFV